MVGRVLGLCLVFAAACSGGQAQPPSQQTAAVAPPIAPTRVTASVTDDPDDPAIWVHPTDPARSLILGTNKVAAPGGALVVFALDGTIRQTVAGIDRPNNVDIEVGVTLADGVGDIAVLTERLKHRLRVFRIASDGSGVSDLAAIPVLVGETGERAEPMGVALYKRPRDGALFAIVAPKTGGSVDYLWQYRLQPEGRDRLTGGLVRRFGHFSGRGPEPGEPGEIEAIVVDDELGFLYYADERFGIHKWHADPDHPDAGRELAVFGLEGYQGDREGLAIFRKADGSGFLVSTDQIAGGSVYKLYRREGDGGDAHKHTVVAEVRTTVDETDGLEVTARPLPGFPGGLVVAMNSGPKNFALFDWNTLFSGQK